MNNRPFLLLGLLSLLFSCRNQTPAPPHLFQLQENTGIDFTNKVVNTDAANILNYRNFYNGGGVAIGDINNDGLPDIFFTSNMGGNKLYLNEGNWHFRDISEKAGFSPSKQQWSTGVVMADVNGDGWLDIYVCNAGHMENGALRENQLFINDRHGGFKDSARQYGLADSGYTTQASFFDYDGDGDLDCFLINNSPMVNTLDYVNQRQMTNLPAAATPASGISATAKPAGGGDHLFRNDNGHFTEVTHEAGIHGSPISLGLGVTVGDVNGDGYPDIYVSNDFFERDYLYINQRNGTFRDEIENWMQHISLASMGADMADINNDGFPDIFTTDMLPDEDYRLKTTFSFENEDIYRLKQKAGFYHQFFQNTLQLNNRNGKFQDIACFAGVNATDWSWGGLIFDMDNDGYNDIYVSNGIAQDLINQDFLDFFANNMAREMQTTGKKVDLQALLEKIPSQPLLNKVFRNDGHLHFADEAQRWGLTQTSFSNGAAYGDLDNDGDLDLVVNNVNQPAFVYRNNSREQNHNHYLTIALTADDKNRFAIGARISAYRKTETLYREIMPARGFQSSVDYRQLIGLGTNPKIDSLVIQWPNGSTTVIDTPGIDRMLTLRQPPPPSTKTNANTQPSTKKSANTPPLLIPIAAGFQRHQEDDYIDFYTEHNLPKMLSRQGPKAAVADVNGDGLEDIYIGGATGHPGQLYIQTTGEKWIKKDEPAFSPFSDFEDGATLFFDANGDGYPDLFLGPGGNNAPPFSRQLQFRLFINDGKGNFHLDANAFPANANNSNSSVAIAGDFNNDGHPDLFIGGLCISREYGATPRSYLFINDGKGHFNDIAATKNADIANIGMVTGAAWANIENNSTKDLVIVGDWLAPRIFSWRDRHFEEINTNLQNLSGWWNCVATADLDGDGHTDLILGNLGQNFYLRPDSTHPVKLWIGDFDGNGIIDKILTRTIDGKDMPVFLKKDMEAQLPGLKKQNLKYAEYAGKSIQQLLPGAALDSARVRVLDFPASIIALNKGNGHFDIRLLPASTQLSTVNNIRPIDIDGDGTADLVLGGNEFGFLPQFGRLDASLGQVLLNDGKGGLTDPGPERSGLSLSGQIRDIALVKGKDHVYLLFLQNDEIPQLYRLP